MQAGKSIRMRFPTAMTFKNISWWTATQRLVLLLVGVTIAALGFAVFQVPYDIAAGGVGGIAIIINQFTGWPVGTTYFVLTTPLLFIGFFYLGRWTFLSQTIVAATLFSFLTDLFLVYLPPYLDRWPITDDVFLSAVYAGVVGGIGTGLVYKAGATMAGSGIISRIIQMKTGIPLSQLYLYVDGGVVLIAGIIFGWELALYAMLTLLLHGMASDYVLEGPSRARTATIVTTRPDEVKAALLAGLGRTVSHWETVGGYSGQARTMMICTFYRPQLSEFKRIMKDVDPDAFISIGVTQQAIGRGFSRET